MRTRFKAAFLAMMMLAFIPVTSAHAVVATDNIQNEIDKALAEQQSTMRQSLSASMQEVCRQVVGSMNGIKDFMGDMSTEHIEYIHNWDMSVRTYKEDKKLDVPRWEQLVDTANLRYDEAMTALAAFVQAPGMRCDSDGPKSDFQTIMVLYFKLIQAIIAYLSAVIDLFVNTLIAQVQAYVTQVQQEVQATVSSLRVNGGKQ